MKEDHHEDPTELCVEKAADAVWSTILFALTIPLEIATPDYDTPPTIRIPLAVICAAGLAVGANWWRVYLRTKARRGASHSLPWPSRTTTTTAPGTSLGLRAT